MQNANLRARVALQALENWPLSAGRELLEFCLNDPSTESSLRTDLEVKKKELDIYHWVILVSIKNGNTEKCGSNEFIKFSSTLGGFSVSFYLCDFSLSDVDFKPSVAVGYMARVEV